MKNWNKIVINPKEFEDLLSDRLELIAGVLNDKGSEYSTTHDKMHNFNAAARRRNITPEEALMGFREKHEVSIDDMINATSRGGTFEEKYIREKIGDSINYLILLEMLLIKRSETCKEENNE